MVVFGFGLSIVGVMAVSYLAHERALDAQKVMRTKLAKLLQNHASPTEVRDVLGPPKGTSADSDFYIVNVTLSDTWSVEVTYSRPPQRTVAISVDGQSP